MKLIHKTACALAIFASVSVPALASIVELKVIGTVTPVACTPMLSGGGVVDYGAINPSTLSATAFTVLSVKDIDISIVCDAPISVALKAANVRSGSVAGATENGNFVAISPINLFGMSGVGVVGLGLSGGKKIGGVAFSIDQASLTLDGIAAQSLSKTYAAATLEKDVTSKFLFNPAWSRMVSWSKVGVATPALFTTMSGKISTQAYMNKTSELDMTKPIALDGMITLEMVYL